MKRLRKYGYKLRWSPYSSAIRAESKKDAARRLRKEYPHASGDFFILF